MHPLLRSLQDLSFSRKGIIVSCTALVLMGLTAAGLTSLVIPLLTPDTGEEEEDRIEILYQTHQRLRFSETAFLPQLEGYPIPDIPGVSGLSFSPEEELAELNRFAETRPEVQGAKFWLGMERMFEGRPEEAIPLFHAENAAFPHPLVRRFEYRAALRAQDRETLFALKADPAYAEEFDPVYLFHLGVITDDWGLILSWFWSAQYSDMTPATLALVTVAGLIWTALMVSLFPRPLHRIYGLLIPIAVLLGMISTWPTVLSGIWLDGRFHLNEGSEFMESLIYFIVSVGLREELCKLLLFTPFLLRVAKPGRDLEALVFGALVGLGFAIEENLSYVSEFEGTGVAVSRFVSANFLHLTLTGVNALALTRAVRQPGSWMADAVQTLGITIGLHGIYNTLLSQPLPGFGDLSYFSGAALIGCGFIFFREIPSLSSAHGLRVSRTALFCWGFSLLFCLEIMVSILFLPFNQALFLTGNVALSAVLIGYIFLHQIQEPLAD